MFSTTFLRIMEGVAEDPAKHVNFNRLCKGGSEDSYKGQEECAHLIARTFITAKKFMTEKISANVNHWQWRYTHVNEYANKPWSMTKLKPLFHRETQVGGNQNTPQVSKYKMSRTLETNLFMGDHTPNFKMVVEFGKKRTDDETLMSIDTGMSENIFGGHYFDMNEKHLKGDLN